MTQRRHDEAIPLWDQLIAEGADIDFLHGMRFHCQLYCCDWSDYDDQAASLTLAVKRGSRADLPCSFLVHSDDPDAQLRCSQIFVAARHPRAPQVVTPPRAVAAARLRIGYLSFDFHEHATAYLIAGLLEAHDRAHFETIALSYGLHGPSPMRVRLEGAVDRFVDLKTTSDEDAAERIRELGIHILVDLKGFTGGARTGILARQPAPVQVNFLGYPGTMGADYVQYLVADRLLIQNVDERHYAEAVIFMPACYQPNDSRRPLPAQVPPRSEFGLPEHGFVFCCFNNLYKITPPTFDSWLDLLLRVPASVLWLLEGTQTAMHRLRSMAQSRGVASTRVVFAPHVDLATHLARYRHADLFLDTLPCNAHTTASDALWMGVPIVTLTGSTFAGRVTTSLLHAVGLPQLCTQSREAYVALALRFARNPADLAAVKTHLESGRHAFRLFDSAAYCRDLERAYRAIWKRHVRGEPPARLDLAACEPEA
jgi:predicted O-linked N-acetylglucosamine transferase (SPINDLY family)